ncbi:TetR/AcrR family transcriptional regulator [Congregibacter brevis]|uniref:TetR/AcrR family transcriptional regulator n=1 Tax=Congregibacter brevis TaxID=3081201 RepID=A0ABZ0IBR6_9GAMM|nr:TetR/AcrR family transcriptional regulator [Congregibacter sp. IMCC45268]
MGELVVAKGQATRQANKERRKKKILSVARSLIADEGFDALTISQLAVRSGVTIPTVHNLFGKKNDIVLEMFRQLVHRVDSELAEPELIDPIAASEVLLDNLLALYGADEDFYRAAFMGGERLGLFEHELNDGVFRKSILVAEKLCDRARKGGYLHGRIDSRWLAQQLFGCQRLARQDWVNGYIDIQTYRQQALIGMLLTFAADATPDLHQRICEKVVLLAE